MPTAIDERLNFGDHRAVMRFLPLMMVVALAGCAEKESAKLERQMEIMKKSGATKEELCDKGRELAKAYLAEENADKFQMSDIESKIACNAVALDRL